MENLDHSSEPKTLTYEEAIKAQDIYTDAQGKLLRKLFMPHIATGLEVGDYEGYRLALIIENERYEKSARKLAKKCIADIPISIRVTGGIRKVE